MQNGGAKRAILRGMAGSYAGQSFEIPEGGSYSAVRPLPVMSYLTEMRRVSAGVTAGSPTAGRKAVSC